MPRAENPVDPKAGAGSHRPAADEDELELDAERVPPAAGEAAVPGSAPAAAPSAELAEMRDQWLRAEAEIQNVRRRAAREREELRRELEDQWLLEAAGLLDDLDRGLAAARTSGATGAWIKGFELSGQRIRELLQRYGVTPVEPVGLPFDPRHHEALLEVEAPAGASPGTVVQVVTRGYMRLGRSLRAAQVAVARGSTDGGA